MLAANEIMVGSVADAIPLSLVLPRSSYESIALVGQRENVSTVVSLSPTDEFRSFAASDGQNWTGLIIPNVRIEVDETSVFDALNEHRSFGNIIRLDTQLAIRAKQDSLFARPTLVTLHNGLASTEGKSERYQAGFSRWQIVIGEGVDKRVLWETSLASI